MWQAERRRRCNRSCRGNALRADDAPRVELAPFALRALRILEDAGYEAWVVGGFVRDALLGRPGEDVDVASSATWREAQRAFEARGVRTHETGTAHGTLTAVVDGHAVEVTTYRADGSYADDARHPRKVTFVRSIEEDLARRDFTVNALAFHPDRGLIDPHGGRADLEAGVLRAVGDPARRFSEDALRILRACRLSRAAGLSHRRQDVFGHDGEQGAAVADIGRARGARAGTDACRPLRRRRLAFVRGCAGGRDARACGHEGL